MEIILSLYPVVLTFIFIVTFLVFLVGFSVWRTRAKARGGYSNKVEVYRVIKIGIPAVLLFLASDITMYQLGADLSIERLRVVFSSFFLAAAWGVYFGLIVPKIFRFDYGRLPFNEPSLRSFPKAMLSGILFFGFAFLTAKGSTILANLLFDTYAPCILSL